MSDVANPLLPAPGSPRAVSVSSGAQGRAGHEAVLRPWLRDPACRTAGSRPHAPFGRASDAGSPHSSSISCQGPHRETQRGDNSGGVPCLSPSALHQRTAPPGSPTFLLPGRFSDGRCWGDQRAGKWGGAGPFPLCLSPTPHPGPRLPCMALPRPRSVPKPRIPGPAASSPPPDPALRPLLLPVPPVPSASQLLPHPSDQRSEVGPSDCRSQDVQGSSPAGWAEGGRTASLRTGTEATWEDGGGNSRAPCSPLGHSAGRRALRCGVSGEKVLRGRGIGALGPAAQAASGVCPAHRLAHHSSPARRARGV